MKTRAEIKEAAKLVMAEQRTTAILLALIPIAISIVGSMLSMIPILGYILSIALSLMTYIISVACTHGYIHIWRGLPASIEASAATIKENPFRKLGSMLLMGLFICLWSLLLYVPGIIKAISYSMTPYILAEHPDVLAQDAITLSRKITQGHKGEIFVMGLSFLGWMLLSGLTFGILTVVYVGPYMSISMSGLYTQLKEQALKEGVISPDELGRSIIG